MSEKTTNPDKVQRIFGLDLVRCICAILIITYHYAENTQNTFKILHTTANSTFGKSSVASFFVVSGAALYLKYPAFTDLHSLKVFWYKRWKSIFPMFYMSYLLFFLQKAISARKILFGPPPSTLILSVLGIDGYFRYLGPNYYCAGEWFLGAIILLYLLYPLICCVMNRCRYVIPALLVAGYVIMLNTDIFLINPYHNMITCIASFYAGILFMKHSELFFRKKISLVISCVVFAVLAFVRSPIDFGINNVILNQLHGFSIVIILVHAGEFIGRYRIRKAVSLVSTLSYPIFLLHHHIILFLLLIHDPLSVPGEVLMLVAVMAVSLISSQILYFVNSKLTKSKLFRSAEEKLIY